MLLERLVKLCTRKKIFRSLKWRQLHAPVIPPKRVVDELLRTRKPVQWKNGLDRTNDPSKNWLMFYLTKFDDGEIVTHLLPGSAKPVKGWLYKRYGS